MPRYLGSLMANSITLDDYLKLKEKKNLTIFIFLLQDEFPHLNLSSSWLQHLKEEIYLLRLKESDFKMLDIGIHPKVIVYRQGRELKEFNGILPLKSFRSEMEKLKRI